MEPEIVYRWTGPRDEKGQPLPAATLIPGVPGRDLTQADLDSLPAHIIADIAASDLYEAAGAQLPLPDEEGA